MKKLVKYIGVISASAMMLASCSVDKISPDQAIRQQSPLDTNAVQLFIFGNTTDVSIKPADGGYSITSGEGTVKDTVKRFPVIIGRHIDTEAQKAAKTIKLDVDTTGYKGLFSFADSVVFAYGQVSDTIWVTTALGFGESGEIAFVIPDQYTSTYGGCKVAEISVAVDYTWLENGTATFVDGFLGGYTGSVKIQKAKEFTNAAGDGLYRLFQPWYDCAGDDQEYLDEGAHLQFLLDKDYEPVTLGDKVNDSKSATYFYIGYNKSYLVWFGTAHPYSAYNSFVRSGNTYIFDGLWLYEGAYYAPCPCSFSWETGCPASIQIDPTKGEGIVNETLTAATATLSEANKFDNPIDETMAEYRVKGSYKRSYGTTIELTGANSSVHLEVTVPFDDALGYIENGTYTVRSQSSVLGNSVFAGAFDGTAPTGSYMTVGNTLYYITSGTMKWENDSVAGTGKITIDAKSANGTELKAVYDGAYVNITIN